MDPGPKDPGSGPRTTRRPYLELEYSRNLKETETDMEMKLGMQIGMNEEELNRDLFD